MPRPRTYATTAERMQAYRQRRAAEIAARQQETVATGLPAAPGVDSIPATKRWDALVQQAQTALLVLQDEMQSYFDNRLEAWQEDERGQAFSERLDNLNSIIEELEQWRD
jgi:hypothetical protein